VRRAIHRLVVIARRDPNGHVRLGLHPRVDRLELLRQPRVRIRCELDVNRVGGIVLVGIDLLGGELLVNLFLWLPDGEREGTLPDLVVSSPKSVVLSVRLTLAVKLFRPWPRASRASRISSREELFVSSRFPISTGGSASENVASVNVRMMNSERITSF